MATLAPAPCRRCGGTGNIPSYWYVDEGMCFRCNGSGVDPQQPQHGERVNLGIVQVLCLYSKAAMAFYAITEPPALAGDRIVGVGDTPANSLIDLGKQLAGKGLTGAMRVKYDLRGSEYEDWKPVLKRRGST